MSREWVYVVQAFRAGKGTQLAADPPIRCTSSDGARRTAERLALSKAGVVAFATSGDAEAGDYDEEPTIIFWAGRLPAAFEEVCGQAQSRGEPAATPTSGVRAGARRPAP